MRVFFFSVLTILLIVSSASSSPTYDRFFTNKTMRVDYFHTGTKGQETFSLDEVIEEGEWPGSKVNLVDTLNLGEFIARVFDVQTNTLIYSRGFSSIFNEWQTTDEALAGVFRTFSESVRLPFPKRKIQFTIARRDKRMEFHELWSSMIDPNDPMQVDKARNLLPFKVNRIMGNGNSSERVDLLILGDGYAKADME